MLRRACVQSQLVLGDLLLDASESRHLRDVLRLDEGTEIELFNLVGQTAVATLIGHDANQLRCRVSAVREPVARANIAVFSAIPKGDRADWMIEKLSEIGVDAWTPIRCQRSVVTDVSPAKRERWQRIAVEAAKQSRRIGAMRIEPERALSELMRSAPQASNLSIVLWTRDADPLQQIVRAQTNLRLFVGPEGGWTDDEMSAFASARNEDSPAYAFARLTRSVLRIETAAVVAAGVALSGPG